jgi:hypothetical protein
MAGGSEDAYRIPSTVGRTYSLAPGQIDYCLYFRTMTTGLHPQKEYTILDHSDTVTVNEHGLPVEIRTVIELFHGTVSWWVRIEQTFVCKELHIQVVKTGIATDAFFCLFHDFVSLRLVPDWRRIPRAWISQMQRKMESCVSSKCITDARRAAWSASVDVEDGKCSTVQ